MHFQFVCTLVLSLIVTALAGDQADAGKKLEESRFISLSSTGFSFTTFTVMKTSTTITSILTSVVSCTTSTATLTTCTVGRRRRGLFYDEAEGQGRVRRGLFYNDDEGEHMEGTALLPASIKSASSPALEVKSEPVDGTSVIPLVVEAGFDVPKEINVNRFLLAFGTKSITSYTVTTSTLSLTAICSSTTGFPLCGSSGK